MSFLGKLGDFAGGFAEGLGESLPRALEAGLDRRIDLMDEERKWARQDAIREQTWARDEARTEEERRYKEDNNLLTSLTQAKDVGGIETHFTEDHHLYDHAQAAVQNILTAENVVQERSSRMLGTLLDKINLQVGDKNFKILNDAGVNPDVFSNYSAELDTAIENAELLKTSPNYQYMSPENQAALDDLILRAGNKQGSLAGKYDQYVTYMGGKADVDSAIEYMIQSGDGEGLLAFIENDGNTHLTPHLSVALARIAGKDVIDRRLSQGDIAGAYEFAGDNAKLIAYIDRQHSMQSGAINESFIETATTLSGLNQAYKVIEESDDLPPTRKAQMLRAADMRYENMMSQALLEVPQRLKSEMTFIKFAEGNAAGVMGEGSDRASVHEMLSRIVASPRTYGLEPWQAERYEWQTQLDNYYQGQPTISFGQRVADYYGAAIRAGAYSKEEVESLLGSVEWLTPKEKRGAIDYLNTQMDTAFGKAAMQGLGGPIRNFRLADIQGFSDMDELYVKRSVRDAALALPEQRELLRVRMIGAIEANSSVVGEKGVAEAKERINDMFESLPEDVNLHESIGWEKEPVSPPSPRASRAMEGAKAHFSRQQRTGNKTTNESLAEDYIKGTSRPKNVRTTSTI